MFITSKIHWIFITEREQNSPSKMMFQEYTLKIVLFKKKTPNQHTHTKTQKQHTPQQTHQPPKPQQQKPNPNNPKIKKNLKYSFC